MASYSVVEFADGIHLVPTLWLNTEKTLCRWPTHFRKQYDVNKAVIRLTKPHDDGKDRWGSFDVKRIFGTADTYETGMQKLCSAEETSNMEETAASNDEAPAIRAKKRRREKAKKHFTSSDEEIPEKQPQSRLQPFPALSQFYKNESKTSTSERRRSASRGASSSPKENRASHVLERSITGLDESLTRRCSEISTSERNRHSPTSSRKNRAFKELARSFTANGRTTQSKFSSPLLLSRTSQSKIEKDNFTDLTIHEKQSKTRDDNNEASTCDGFMELVLFKLNKVLCWMKELDKTLLVLAEHGHNLHRDEFDSEDEKELGLPLQDVPQLITFEEKLKNTTFFAKMIKWLQRFGGTDINTSTHKILGKLLSNPLAQQYSWAGLKGKQSFKDLRLVRLVMKTVRVRVPGASDVIFADIISKWLAQAKLRNTREIAKTTIQKKAASAENRTKRAANAEEDTAANSE